MFRVVNDIPMPEGKGKGYKYPFDQMNPGDSFDIPCNDIESARKARHSVIHAATYRKKRVRTQLINGRDQYMPVVRVWLAGEKE